MVTPVAEDRCVAFLSSDDLFVITVVAVLTLSLSFFTGNTLARPCASSSSSSANSTVTFRFSMPSCSPCPPRRVLFERRQTPACIQEVNEPIAALFRSALARSMEVLIILVCFSRLEPFLFLRCAENHPKPLFLLSFSAFL